MRSSAKVEGKAEGVRGKGMSGKEGKGGGKGDTNAGSKKAKDSVACWRCRAPGRYGDSGTKIRERCGGWRHLRKVKIVCPRKTWRLVRGEGMSKDAPEVTVMSRRESERIELSRRYILLVIQSRDSVV